MVQDVPGRRADGLQGKTVRPNQIICGDALEESRRLPDESVRLDRKFLGIELNPEYVELARKWLGLFALRPSAAAQEGKEGD